MPPILWKVIRRLRRYGNRARTARCLRALALAEDERIRHVALSMHRARQRLDNADEEKWIERIEKLRRRLSGSAEVIEDVDYGSGAPADNPSAEEMSEGRDDRITLGDQTRLSSLPEDWCRLLFHLVRACRPTSCLELGTSVGISACYQAAALKLAGAGNLVTLEGAARLARRAEKNTRTLGLENVEVVTGRFQDTLDDVLKRVQPVDWAFVDGHHDERATVDYCSRIIPHMSPNAVLVLDDITWSDSMLRAWREVSSRDDVAFAVDLHQIGIIGLGTPAGSAVRCRAIL